MITVDDEMRSNVAVARASFAVLKDGSRDHAIELIHKSSNRLQDSSMIQQWNKGRAMVIALSHCNTPEVSACPEEENDTLFQGRVAGPNNLAGRD